MPANTAIIEPLLQRTLDLMETASCWERQAAKKAHMAGLQGEKRRLRWLSRQARNIVDSTEHMAYDVFQIDICAAPGTVDVSALVCPISTMNGLIEKLWTIHDSTSKLANELVIVGFKPFANPLNEYAEKLLHILGELQRAQTEYDRAEYEYHHISRYQVGWQNVHDDYERLEKEQGYTDYKD